jgi:hypothetical protein
VSISARWFLDLADQALRGLNEQTQASLDAFLMGAGDLPDWDVSFIQLAHHLEPDHLTPQLLMQCCPYAHPDSFTEKLRKAARRGWLRERNGEFLLTFRGREVAQEITELSDRLFAKIVALPPSQMKRLLTLLDQVVAKIKTLPAPTEKVTFELSLRFERTASAPTLSRIRRRLIDLLAFYDDVHLVVRLPHEASGLLWETFTYVWRGDAHTAPDLAACLVYRNYAEEDYAAALRELAARDWIVLRDDEQYFVQEEAAQMRQQVEENTDQLFETALSDLNTAEATEFKQLMKGFCWQIGV